MEKPPIAAAPPAPAVPAVLRFVRFCYTARRKFATVAAFALAAWIGWHAIVGPNGVIAYQAKRKEAAQLAVQIAVLRKENARMSEHNGRLQKDPEAIEGAIRSHLRYAKPNEVIVTVDPVPSAAPASAAPPQPAR